MKKLALVTLVFFALASVSLFANAKKKSCGPKSKACGNTCIAENKECHVKGNENKGVNKKKNCGPKSKPCGNSCISLNKKCEK